MSATGTDIFNFIKRTVSELKKKDTSFRDEVYELPDSIQKQIEQDYNYVDNLWWLFKKEHIISLLNYIYNNKKGKAIYFADSIQKIKHIIDDKSLEIDKNDYCFYYSDNSNTTEFAKSHKKINDISNFIKSDKKFLFTTIALDNGVDIKDFNVKYLISNVFDFDGVIQCLGRKRVVNEHDKCMFFVVIPNNKELENKYEKIKADMAEIDLFKESPNK